LKFNPPKKKNIWIAGLASCLGQTDTLNQHFLETIGPNLGCQWLGLCVPKAHLQFFLELPSLWIFECKSETSSIRPFQFLICIAFHFCALGLWLDFPLVHEMLAYFHIYIYIYIYNFLKTLLPLGPSLSIGVLLHRFFFKVNYGNQS
jgi:hypothetical protein